MPPPIGYPPLPPRAAAPMPRRPSKHSPPGIVSPYAEWGVNKTYHFPTAYDGHPIVNEILTGALSDQTRSEVGLDDFNYQVRLRPPPAQCQEAELIETLQLWARCNPHTLVYHLFHESLDQVLGHAYPWAVFGKAKTLSRRRERRPW